jgi:YVTN family beta-propeller protein
MSDDLAQSNGFFNNVTVIDTATDTVTATIPISSPPLGLAVTPGTHKLYIAHDPYDMTVIDTTSNSVFTWVSRGSLAVTASPDGKTVYVGNLGSGDVSVINADDNTVIGRIAVNGQPFDMAVSPDGATLYVGIETPGHLLVIATGTHTVTNTIPVGYSVMGVAISPDGRKVYVTNQGNSESKSPNVAVITTATNMVTARIPVGRVEWASPMSVAVTPDGSKVYVVNNASGDVSVIDTSTNTVIGSPITVGDRPRGVTVTPDSGKVYVANEFSNSVSVIATATNTVIATIPVMTLPIGVAVGSNGSKVFVGTMVPVRGSAQSGALPTSGT